MSDYDSWITTLTDSVHKSSKCLNGTACNHSSVDQPGRSHAND